jgi:hypothetical protein
VLESEIAHIPELNEIGKALVQFARAQFPGLTFEATGQDRYVAAPENFVTFSVHWKRAKNITVTLRGNPFEFAVFEELPLKADMGGYASFKLEHPRQLAAAAMHIQRAAELYKAGRTRSPKALKVVEG